MGKVPFPHHAQGEGLPSPLPSNRGRDPSTQGDIPCGWQGGCQGGVSGDAHREQQETQPETLFRGSDG